ncbi:hypothetical protein FF011L_04830 [Roseimaritima multifibrata]|uniref:DUF421 domain-containing protein n=1 Tax=Roseimaritima multifibrata TaxID=1930274 RepID=A0A517MA38_9BACT|nr:YetF domain-containing protein [Roseimaritima multifibrata]QDS91748.1 hypothetical protein FF011L_04830 [Roseimaritima multifibrata]
METTLLANFISGKMFFDGWAPVVRTLVLGTIGYAALILILRVSGKRTLSKMNAFDFIVTIALGSTLASALTSQSVSLVQGITALGLLVLLQLVSTWLAVRYRWYSKLVKSEPALVFFQGRCLREAMKKQRVTKEEILAAMRQSKIAQPSEVAAVVIETEGTLSVIPEGPASAEELRNLGIDGTPNV